MSEEKWLSEFDIVEHLEHLKNQINRKEYNKLKYNDRYIFFSFDEHTNKKKGKLKYLYKNIFDDKNLLSDKYFFEIPNFKFKIFITYKHFVCVIRIRNKLEYFDPTYRKENYEYKRLIPLLNNQNLNKIISFEINKIRLQYNNYSCGRWCILRCLMFRVSFNKFLKIVKEKKKNIILIHMMIHVI
jgi:hypothetical protein